MTTAAEPAVPDFLAAVITPGSYDEGDRQELRDLAVRLLVDHQKLQRAGDSHRLHLLLHVLPAVDHAVAVGWDNDEIHADAAREYAQWLIDNAGK